MNTPNLFHFTITMYCHYDDRIQQYKHNPPVRKLLEQAQKHYALMFSLLVPFDEITSGLPISSIKK